MICDVRIRELISYMKNVYVRAYMRAFLLTGLVWRSREQWFGD